MQSLTYPPRNVVVQYNHRSVHTHDNKAKDNEWANLLIL